MNKKMNNKGFSLVELIVVIAIMGILAITLAPKLTSYIEKTRKAADDEVINAVMTATKLGFVEENIYSDYTNIATKVFDETDTDLVVGYTMTLAGTGASAYYTVATDTWTAGTSTNAYIAQLYDIVGKTFKFKSTSADAGTTQITVNYDIPTDLITILFTYDGTSTAYTVTSK